MDDYRNTPPIREPAVRQVSNAFIYITLIILIAAVVGVVMWIVRGVRK